MKLKLKFTAKPKDAIIFFIFCFFLLYLVAIGVLNLYYLSHDNVFWGINPFPAFGKKFIVTTLVFYLFALIGVFMSTSDYFFKREKGFGFGKKKDDDSDGWSRWMKDEEMKKAYDVKKINLKNDEYEHAGIPIIINDKEAWVDDGENHSLIIGASGSGKTWTIIDPLVKILGKSGESMIVTDPKGEIYEHNANLLREKGYKVILVNFRDPENGSAWNPLSLPYRYYKDGKEDKAMELLEDLGMNILVDANNQDPFWQKSAADYFTGLALGLFEDAESEDEVNLNSINAMSTFGEERIGASKYDKEYFKLKGELSSAYISAAATITAPADTKGGITSTFRQKIRIFSSRQKLAEMLSYTDFDVRQIGKEKTAVFLKIHDEKTTYHALATIFVKQVYECLIDEAQKEESLKLRVRTNFILDEFANMPALKDVESMITASRSRNMRFNFVIQNFSQLNKVYGKEVAETIKGNCGNMFYLITTEYSALEEISKMLGDVKPKDAKEGKPQPPIRPLVTVSDLQQMKKFQMIIKRWRNQPYKTKHTPSFEITKNGGWGYQEVLSDYPVRQVREIKTFDLKKFVDEHRKESPMGFGAPGSSPFVPPFGAPSMNRGVSGNMPTGVNPMMGGNPFGPMNAPMSNPNVDELVKKIDAQIAKLEEEERLEKEKLAKGEVSKEDKQNDFEKLINKKYEDFKLGESKLEDNKNVNNLPNNVNNPAQNNIPLVNPEVVNNPFMQSFNPSNSNLNPSPSSLNVDDLIRKIDAKIAELEKEEEEERRKEAQSNNLVSGKETVNNSKVDIDAGEFVNPFKMSNVNNPLIKEAEVKEQVIKKPEDVINKLHDNIVNSAPQNMVKEDFGFPNPFMTNEISGMQNNVKKEEVVSSVVNQSKENLDLKVNNNFKPDVSDLLKPEVKIDNSNAEEIVKPKINIDVDSIVTKENITDDEFFDDFFGDDDM
jgi:type IV secretion system protein VirD4